MANNNGRLSIAGYGLGAVLAIIALVIVVVLWIVGRLDPVMAIVLALLALSRLT